MKPAIQMLSSVSLRQCGKPCAYCGTSMTGRGSGGDRPTRDHVVPKSKGGTKRRIVWSCADCNQAKSSLLPGQFYDLCEAVAAGAAHFAKKRWGWYLEKSKLVVARHTRDTLAAFVGEPQVGDFGYALFQSYVLVYLCNSGSSTSLTDAESSIVSKLYGNSPRACAEEIMRMRKEAKP